MCTRGHFAVSLWTHFTILRISWLLKFGWSLPWDVSIREMGVNDSNSRPRTQLGELCAKRLQGDQHGPGTSRFLYRQLSSVGRVQGPVPASPSLSTQTRSRVFLKSFLDSCSSKQKRQEMTTEEFLIYLKLGIKNVVC